MIPNPILPLHIDSTMLSCFRSCPQKYYNEFILGLRPTATSVDLHAGACFSSALERFYRETWEHDADTPTATARAYKTFYTEWGNFTSLKDTAKTFDNMWKAVEDYISTYPPKTDHVQPFFVAGRPSFEFSFAIPLDFPGFPLHPSGSPFVYVGRFDLLGKYHDRPCVRDEKTAGRLEGNWAEKWDLRSQFMGYCWALQQHGIPCDTTIVRGVIITKTMIRQVEAIKIYSDFLISRWFDQLRRDLIRLRSAWDEGHFDFNLGESCVAYSHCPYMTLCASPQPELWYPNYVVKRWNPLDRNPLPPDESPASVASFGNEVHFPPTSANVSNP